MRQSKVNCFPAVVLALLAASCTRRIDPPPVAWLKTFGNGPQSYFSCIRETRDGGFILAGAILSEKGNRYDFYVVRTNLKGEEIWARILGGDLDERATSVEETRDGGYIVTGNSGRYDKGPADCRLTRLGHDGSQLWTKTYGGRGSEEAWAVWETADGGIILGGWTTSFGVGQTDVYLLKTDASGELLWQKTFGGENYDGHPLGGLQLTRDGGFVIATSTSSVSLGARKLDVYLIRTGSSGEKIWEVPIGGDASESGTSVDVDADGGFVIGGTREDQVYLARTNSSGKLIWDRTYGRGVDCDPVSVRFMNGRAIIAVARTLHATADACSDLYLIRADPEGRVNWETTLARDGYDSGYSIDVLTGGGFAVAGSNTQGALLARFDPETR